MLRALRKILLETAGLGLMSLPLVLGWAWTEQFAVPTIVLVLLACGAAVVTLMIVVLFASLPVQYFRHRRALRDEVRRRGALAERDRQKALAIHRMSMQTSYVYRDPRVIPWWEWLSASP